jgi:hypothetical protein
VIWPWQRRRRAAAARLSALGVSVEDERLDPDVILRKAELDYSRLAGRWRGDRMDKLRPRFAPPDLATLLRLCPTRPGHDYLATADPEDVSLWLRPRPGLSLVDFRVAADGGRAQAAVLVSARARSWLTRWGYWGGRARAMWVRVAGGGSGPPALGARQGSDFPAARSRRLAVVWVFEHSRPSGWVFRRTESLTSAGHRFDHPLDSSDELHAELRDHLVLGEAAQDRAGLKIPREIAENLPYEAKAALLELAGVSERFEGHVLEAAVRRILDLWARASEGETELLAGGASAEAVRQLLDPPGIVLRGPELLSARPRRIRALRVPPEVTLELDVRAYLGVPELDDGIRRKRRLWWRLAAQDSPELPWRLVDAEVSPFRP